MSLPEEIKQFLPKFLSEESSKELFKCLDQFPENIDSRIYTSKLSATNTLFQGDAIRDLIMISLPQKTTKNALGMVLSNTCDVSLDNERKFIPMQIVYAPIIELKTYTEILLEELDQRVVDSHLVALRNQEITQIFYLPQLNNQPKESVVFFDRVCNCDNDYISGETLQEKRIFTLSDYGWYLFLIKLSIHFTRIQDKVDRGSLQI